MIDKKKFRKSTFAFQREVVDKMSALATAAFGLVAALAWNSAIQAVFAKYYKPGDATWALLAYAAAVTVIAVVVILVIGRIAGRLKEAHDKEIAQENAAQQASG